MDIEEQLWRIFQRRFARLLNKLPKHEQKEFFFIFGLRNELVSNFDFKRIEFLLKKRIEAKKRERKRTKAIRKQLGLKEEVKQKSILKQTSKSFAKGIFENRDIMLRKNNYVINKTRLNLQNTTSGCEFYPCEKK